MAPRYPDMLGRRFPHKAPSGLCDSTELKGLAYDAAIKITPDKTAVSLLAPIIEREMTALVNATRDSACRSMGSQYGMSMSNDLSLIMLNIAGGPRLKVSIEKGRRFFFGLNKLGQIVLSASAGKPIDGFKNTSTFFFPVLTEKAAIKIFTAFLIVHNELPSKSQAVELQCTIDRLAKEKNKEHASDYER